MWFFKKINKFDQTLVRFIKKNNWTHKLPTSWVKNLNIDPSDINWIIIYEQFEVYTFKNLDWKIDDSL